jgi:hypothetical protein
MFRGSDSSSIALEHSKMSACPRDCSDTNTPRVRVCETGRSGQNVAWICLCQYACNHCPAKCCIVVLITLLFGRLVLLPGNSVSTVFAW